MTIVGVMWSSWMPAIFCSDSWEGHGSRIDQCSFTIHTAWFIAPPKLFCHLRKMTGPNLKGGKVLASWPGHSLRKRLLRKCCVSEAEKTPEMVELLLEEFADMFPEELSEGLLPLWDIQHQIDLVLSSSLPKTPHYCMRTKKHVAGWGDTVQRFYPREH